MKKRAQVPDAQTFTILFRGFAAHPDFRQSQARSLKLYESMFTPNSPVKPSLIHTNAVLNVCARAKDLDALLGIAAKLPTRGRGAPDKITFTTIMNAIRAAAAEVESVQSRHKAADQGRRIWGEVKDRWRQGDIVLDESLICATGRLLLLGRRHRDWDDVLSLAEQTMGIPRQARPSTATQPVSLPEGQPEDKQSIAVQPASSGMEGEDEEVVSNKEFDTLHMQKIQYVRPGCNTLSMILNACIGLRAFRTAQDYWGLLTDPSGEYNITPDPENFHAYLRLLRAQRASKRCVEMLEGLRYPSDGKAWSPEPKVFRIALSVCVRDHKNANVLLYANRLIRMMMDTLEKPDLPSLYMYLNLATSEERRDWKSLVEVLRCSTTCVQNLRSFLAYGEETDKRRWRRDNEEVVIQYAGRLQGTFDMALALGEGKMTQEDKKFCLEQKHTLSSWVSRMRFMGRGHMQQAQTQAQEVTGSNDNHQKPEEEKDKEAEIEEVDHQHKFTKEGKKKQMTRTIATEENEIGAPGSLSSRDDHPRPPRLNKHLLRRPPPPSIRSHPSPSKFNPSFKNRAHILLDADDDDHEHAQEHSLTANERAKRFLGNSYRPSLIYQQRQTSRESAADGPPPPSLHSSISGEGESQIDHTKERIDQAIEILRLRRLRQARGDVDSDFGSELDVDAEWKRGCTRRSRGFRGIGEGLARSS